MPVFSSTAVSLTFPLSKNYDKGALLSAWRFPLLAQRFLDSLTSSVRNGLWVFYSPIQTVQCSLDHTFGE